MNIILIIPLLLFSKFTIASGENEHSIQEINEALSISETTTPSVPQLNQPSASANDYLTAEITTANHFTEQGEEDCESKIENLNQAIFEESNINESNESQIAEEIIPSLHIALREAVKWRSIQMKIALGRNDSIWKEDKSGKKLSTEKLIIDLQAEIEFLKCAKLLDPELQEFEDSILERRFLYHKKSKENKFILSSGSIFFSTTEGQQIVFKILKNYIIYEINGRESEIKAKRLLKTEIARLRSLFWQVPTTSIEHTMKDFQLLSNARLIEADRALFACETRKRTISIKLLDQDHPHCAMLMPDGANSSCADSKIAHLINIIQTDMGRFRETKKHKQNYDETWPEEQLMNWLIESEFIYRNKHNSKHFFLFKKTTLSLQNICKKFKISYINLANYNEFLAFK